MGFDLRCGLEVADFLTRPSGNSVAFLPYQVRKFFVETFEAFNRGLWKDSLTAYNHVNPFLTASAPFQVPRHSQSRSVTYRAYLQATFKVSETLRPVK
jgi:hypothetical protein